MAIPSGHEGKGASKMPCRVGITTDEETRKAYWQNRVNGLRNWQTHDWCVDKQTAQQKEDELVEHCNKYENRGTCHGHAGGGDPEEIGWTVYSFDYNSDPSRSKR